MADQINDILPRVSRSIPQTLLPILSGQSHPSTGVAAERLRLAEDRAHQQHLILVILPVSRQQKRPKFAIVHQQVDPNGDDLPDLEIIKQIQMSQTHQIKLPKIAVRAVVAEEGESRCINNSHLLAAVVLFLGGQG